MNKSDCDSQSLVESDGDEIESTTMSFQHMLEPFLIEPKKNRNIVEVLCEIKRCLEAHNRVMLMLYEHLSHSKA